MAGEGRFQNIKTPYLTMVEESAPATPDAGHQRLFIDVADGALKKINDAAVVEEISGTPYIPTVYHVHLFTPDANTSFATIGNPDTQGHAYYSTGTLNNEATWNVNLPSGTYKIVVRHSKANNRGVYHVYFDGVDEGNFDGYNASTAFVINSITGLAWVGGVVAIKIKMESKHASSTDYFGVLYDIYLVRTGD
jgi:hypothetical protein